MTNISEMVFGVDIVVRQKPLCGEVVDEATVLEMVVDLFCFFKIVRATDILLLVLGECSPLGLRKSVAEHMER